MKKFLFILIASLVFLLVGCKNAFIYEHVVTKIAIQNEPTKTVYNVGEEADWSGLEVKAIYFDGKTEIVTPDSITGFDSSVAVESQSITVSYKEKTATFTITIKNAETNQNKTLSSIAITTNPTKLVYKVGEEADWSGLVVTATYSDNSTAVIPIADCNITGFNSTSVVETQTITVSYGGKTATFNIRIKPTRNEMLKHITDTFCFFNYASYNQNSNYERCFLVSQPNLSRLVPRMTSNENFFSKTDSFIMQNDSNNDYINIIDEFRDKFNNCRTQYNDAVNAFMNNSDKIQYMVAYYNLYTEFSGKLASIYNEPTTEYFKNNIIDSYAYPMTFSVTDEEVEEYYGIVYNLTKDWIKGEQKSEEIKVASRNYVLSLEDLFEAKKTYAYELSEYFNTNKPAFFKALLNYLDSGTSGEENKLGNRYTWLSMDTMYDNYVLVQIYGLDVFSKVYFKDGKAYYCLGDGDSICFEIEEGGTNPTKTLSSIAITTNPTKTTYKVGDSSDWTGLKVTATYSDGTTPVVTPDSITGFDSSVAVDSQTITVSYGGKTATFNIRIKPTRYEMLKHITDTFCFLAIGSYNPNSNYEKCLFVTGPDNHLVTELTNNEYFFNNTDNFIRTYNNSNYIMIQDFTEKLNDYRTQYNNAVYDFMNNSDKIQCIVAYVNLYTEFIEPIGSLYSEPTTFSFYSTVTDSNTYPMTSSATDEEVEEYYDIVYNLTKNWIKGEQKSEEIKVACRNYVLNLRELFDAKKTYAYELSNYFYTNNSEFFKELLNALDTEHLGEENNLGNRYTLSMDTMYEDYVLVKVYGLDCYGQIYFKDGKAYYCLGEADSICFE